MRRVIIFKDTGKVEAYSEWDIVIAKICSTELYNERTKWIYNPYEWITHDAFKDKFENMYWDKYILCRIMYISIPYSGKKVEARVDFISPTSNWLWKHMYPLWRSYNYFNANHLEMKKVLDINKIDRWAESYKKAMKNIMNSKELCWVPTSQIVMHNGMWYGNWKDIKNSEVNNLLNRIDSRRTARMVTEQMHEAAARDNELASTPNE